MVESSSEKTIEITMRLRSHAIVVRLPGDCSVLFTNVEIMVLY